MTEQPLYRYYENPSSATHRYMKDLESVYDRFVERKAALVDRFGLAAKCPRWRENTDWAGLLIAVGNAYAKGSGRTWKERQAEVEHWCRRPDMARAVSSYRPEGLGRAKKIVAQLIRRKQYGLLTLLYRVKNRS